MTLNRSALLTSLLLSALALAVVLANILGGVGPQADETTSAHLWQLLMGLQLPLVAISVATADWRRRSTAPLLALQVTAIAAACVPVWLAGY
jgi:peptidoglycan/LPS O-acetylase OafA/YrhL